MRFLAVFTVLVGCSLPDFAPPAQPARTEPAVWIHGDTRFNREERMIFELACEKWREFTAGGANLGIKWDLDEERLIALKDQPRLVKVDSMDARTRAIDSRLRRGRVRGFLHPRDARFPMIMGVVSDRVPELFPVALHELGHAAGLDELPDGQVGVMNAECPTWKFTAADWDECIRVGTCRGTR